MPVPVVQGGERVKGSPLQMARPIPVAGSPWPEVITHEDIIELVEMDRRNLLWAMMRRALRCMDHRALTLPVLKSWDYGRCDG